MTFTERQREKVRERHGERRRDTDRERQLESERETERGREASRVCLCHLQRISMKYIYIYILNISKIIYS